MVGTEFHAVILAGGRGTRFWPASRHGLAKQFLPVAGERSLLERTWERLDGLVPRERRWVIAGADQERDVRAALGELARENLLLEPTGKNTAAAAAWSALAVRRRAGDATLALLPADHAVPDAGAFRTTLAAAYVEARRSAALITLGVRPTRPATGYGYIELGPALPAAEGCRVHRVTRFVEKPDESRAREFLAAGNFLWNAGVFIWRSEAILEEFARHAPDIHGPLLAAGDDERIAAIWRELPARSVDVAILERARDVRVLPFEHAWSDVGSWAAISEVVPGDEQGNWPSGAARILAEAASGCVVHAPAQELVALLGVEDLVVVRAGTATLVCRRERAEDVRRIVARLEREAPEFL